MDLLGFILICLLTFALYLLILDTNTNIRCHIDYLTDIIYDTPNTTKLERSLTNYYKIININLDIAKLDMPRKYILYHFANLTLNTELNTKLEKLLDTSAYYIESLLYAYKTDNFSKKDLFTKYLYENAREIGRLLDYASGNYNKHYLHLLTEYVELIMMDLNY
jgi:hypothetical protein